MKRCALVLCGLSTALLSQSALSLGQKRALLGDERTFVVVHDPKDSAGNYVCEPALFGPRFPTKPGLTEPLAWVEPTDACSEFSEATKQNIKGKIALIDRGDCYFVDKVHQAEKAGAKGVVIINNVYSPEYILIASYENATNVNIPSCLISRRDGEHIVAGFPHNSNLKATATIKDGQTEVLTMASDGAKFEVWVDGVKESATSGGASSQTFTIKDTYKLVAFHATAASSKDPKVLVSVTDGFISDGVAWVCDSSDNQPQGDWYSFNYDDTKQGSWKAPTVKDTPTSLKPGNYIWGDAGAEHVYCRGYRYLDAVEVDGYKYKYFNNMLSWDEAEKACTTAFKDEDGDGHLVSIHSDLENQIVHALLPPTTNAILGAWIGMNDKDIEGEYIWSDNTAAEYTNWRRGEPNNRNGEEDCVQIDQKLMWNDLNCDQHRLPYVCKLAVGKTKDEDDLPDDTDQPQCLLYWNVPSTPDDYMHPAQKLTETKGGLCQFEESEYSCCSASYIDQVVHTRWALITASISKNRCKSVLKEVICFECGSKQSDYTILGTKGMTTRWCEDTCVTVWESCKDDPQFIQPSPDFEPIKDAMHLCQVINELDSAQMQFEIAPAESDNCYRYDNLPPLVESYIPKPDQQVNADLNALTAQFNEQVQAGEGSIFIKDPSGKTVEIIDVSDPQRVTFSKTVWNSDTMHIMINPEGSACAFSQKGTYSIEIPGLTIVDRAGNSFDGNTGTGYTWKIQASGGKCKRGGKSHGGMVFGFIAVAAIAGGLFYWQWKRKRDAALAYGVIRSPGGGVAQEGDVVQTESGPHQVRLVPVFDPASGPDGKDGSSNPAEHPSAGLLDNI